MFKLRKMTRGWVFVGLAACAVFLAGANPEVGEASSPKAPKAVAPTLGAAGSFAVLGAVAVTNTGPTILTGDLGISPNNASSITGFPPGLVIGTIHAADGVALQAQTDTTTAYNALASQACDFDLSGQDLGGKTLVPGVYCFSSSAQLTGQLTLTGLATDVWVFRIGSTLTTASASRVVLASGASPCNVFWQVGSSATLGTTTAFQGNILALASITMNTGATVTGRALARTAAVTLDTNNVSAVCPAAPGATPTTVPPAATQTAVAVTQTAIAPQQTATIAAARTATAIAARTPTPVPSAPKEVPEGDTLLLFGGGIGGLATWIGWQWRKVRMRSKK